MVVIGAVVVVGMLLFLVVGMISIFSMTSDEVQSESLKAPAETHSSKPDVDANSAMISFREIRLPEETRKRIYKDYRSVARTTIEKPLPLPQGSAARAPLERMLQQTLDRELNRFSALHNISLDDVNEVIKEGDAKVWDPSPRSNAFRNGKRLYSEEMSEGWKPSANIR